MSSAQFKLDMFEGPLDLLLHLISKHKLNIYDIEIAVLLDQYLEYLDNLDHDDYEDAADFLEMAARLIYIKTCSLLPQPEEAAVLKKELEGRIIEYSLCKKAAQRLGKHYIGGEVFVREPVKLPINKTFTRVYSPMDLYNAYMGMTEKARTSKPLKANLFKPIVSKKIVSVTSKIIFILKKLFTCGEFDMQRLYDGVSGKSERVATFLAVLELTKSGRIFLNDDNTKIYMNSASKRHKIKSDYDVSENAAENTIAAQQPIALQDISAEDVDNAEIHLKNAEKPLKKSTSYATEKQHSYVYPMKEKSERKKIAVPAMADISPRKDADSDLTVDSSQDSVEEDILPQPEFPAWLSKEPSSAAFKPNYNLRCRYYWGYSPVGDDLSGNYWRYGHFKI